MSISTQNPWQPHRATIQSIVREIDSPACSVFTLTLALDPGPWASSYRFKPGQFNMLHLPGSGEVAISHCGPPSDIPQAQLPNGSFLHTIRAVGRVTRAIESLRVGDHLGVRGPYGNPWPIDELVRQDVMIVSGGLGMAPLRPVIYTIANHRSRFGQVDLLYGSRSPDLILYQSELKSWAASNILIETTVDRTQAAGQQAWTGPIGPVTLLMDRRSSKLAYPDFDPSRTQVLICGPEVMMHYCALSALKLGIPSSSIWISMERNMQCGVGYCGHCQWGPFFLCKDGPVLRYDLAEPYLSIKDL
ncbi:MAG: FAD/NAD(P)-binding protein [Pirellula sp.]